MITKAKTLKTKSREQSHVQKKYNKQARSNEEEHKLLEFVEEEEEEQQLEVVAKGGQISCCVLSSNQNKITKNIVKTKFIRKGQLFHLPITSI